MSITLSLNAVSAAWGENPNADDSAQLNTLDSADTISYTHKPGNTRYEGTFSDSQTTTATSYAAGSAAGSPTVLKILIYSGTGTSANCVNGLKTCFSNANTNELLSGVTFNYASSSSITSTKLAGYDLLIMPGGTSGALYLNTVSKSVIQNFVKNGGGYIGICAGAYAAAARTDGYYNGWAIAPHVNCKAVSYEGKLNMNITSLGEQVLNRSGYVTIAHFNGPAMYTTSNTAKIFGTYADSKTGYKGYTDIVGDYYGNGRTVLIGSHPELSPQFPDIIANLAAWATKTLSTPTNPTEVTINEAATAATKVKAFYDKKKRLPSYVYINNTKITMPKFLYLLTTATTQVNSGSTEPITVKYVSTPSNPTGTYKKGIIPKTEYLNLAKNITNFINNNGRAPNYVSTSLGKINYTKMIYMFAKIWRSYDVYDRLPNNVSMT